MDDIAAAATALRRAAADLGASRADVPHGAAVFGFAELSSAVQVVTAHLDGRTATCADELRRSAEALDAARVAYTTTDDAVRERLSRLAERVPSLR